MENLPSKENYNSLTRTQINALKRAKREQAETQAGLDLDRKILDLMQLKMETQHIQNQTEIANREQGVQNRETILESKEIRFDASKALEKAKMEKQSTQILKDAMDVQEQRIGVSNREQQLKNLAALEEVKRQQSNMDLQKRESDLTHEQRNMEYAKKTWNFERMEKGFDDKVKDIKDELTDREKTLEYNRKDLNLDLKGQEINHQKKVNELEEMFLQGFRQSIETQNTANQAQTDRKAIELEKERMNDMETMSQMIRDLDYQKDKVERVKHEVALERSELDAREDYRKANHKHEAISLEEQKISNNKNAIKELTALWNRQKSVDKKEAEVLNVMNSKGYQHAKTKNEFFDTLAQVKKSLEDN